MSKALFPELTWEILVSHRPTTLVVDSLHGYAIIKDRLDTYWHVVRTAPPSEEKDALLLTSLASIAAAAQATGECLGLVEEQMTHEEIETRSKEDVDKAKRLFQDIINKIGGGAKRASSHQAGTPRFSFEFDRNWFRDLQDATGCDYNPRTHHHRGQM